MDRPSTRPVAVDVPPHDAAPRARIAIAIATARRLGVKALPVALSAAVLFVLMRGDDTPRADADAVAASPPPPAAIDLPVTRVSVPAIQIPAAPPPPVVTLPAARGARGRLRASKP